MSNYTLQCKDPIWVRQYDRMLADGISQEKMDQKGYYVWKKGPDGSVVAKQVGNGDRKIECEEIAETTVDHERYYDFLRVLTGRPVAWHIKDRSILEKIDQVIDLARRALDEQGLRAGSTEYDQGLSTALTYLAAAPKKSWMEYYSRRDPIYLRTTMARLDMQGLSAVRTFLMKEGGFGLAFSKMDDTHEYTVEQVIKKGGHVAKCTERAAVLYALFERAGLKPCIALLTVQQVKEVFSGLFGGKLPMISQQEEFQGHAVAALNIGGKMHYYEFSPDGGMVGEMPYDGKAVKISPREFYQAAISNFVIFESSDRKRHIEGGLKLGRSLASDLLHGNRTYISDDANAKIGALKAALADNPGSRFARYSLAKVHMDAGNFEEAEAGFKALLPGVPTAYYQLGLLYMQRAKWGLSMLHYKLAMERDSLKTGLKMLDAGFQTGNIYLGIGDHANAENYYRNMLNYNDKLPAIYRNLGKVVWMQGRDSDAVPLFEKALDLSLVFGDVETASDIAGTLLLLSILSGRFLRASHYFNMLSAIYKKGVRQARGREPFTEEGAKKTLLKKLRSLGKNARSFTLVRAAVLAKTGDTNGAAGYYRSLYGSDYCRSIRSGDIDVMRNMTDLIGDRNLLVGFLDSCYHRKYYIPAYTFANNYVLEQHEDGSLHYLFYKAKALWDIGRKKEAGATIKDAVEILKRIEIAKIDNYSVFFQMYESARTLSDALQKKYSTELTEFFTRIASWYETGGDLPAALHIYAETPILKAQAQKFRDVIVRLQKKVASIGQ